MRVRGLVWVGAFASLLSFAATGCSKDEFRAPAPGADLAVVVPAAMDMAERPPEDLKTVRNLDAACAASWNATPRRIPVDVVLAVENEASMAGVIEELARELQPSLATPLDQRGVDLRIIAITGFGGPAQQAMCVGAPLTGNVCAAWKPGQPPVNGPRFFHYDRALPAGRAFGFVLEAFKMSDAWRLAPGGWSTLLRKGALVAFVEVVDRDDNVAAQVDFQLRALDPVAFGTAKQRNFAVHAVAGFQGKGPPGAPWLPGDPLVAAPCNALAPDPATELQKLSLLTGGLRFSVCENGQAGAWLRGLAAVLVERSDTCEYQVPAAPPLESLDLKTLSVRYTSPLNANQPVELRQVGNPGACAADSYYLVPGGGGLVVVLCPPTCARIRADAAARIDVLADCERI